MNEVVKNPVREMVKIINAQDSVAQAYAHFWATRIAGGSDQKLIAQWQDAFDQARAAYDANPEQAESKPQQTLWGFIYSCKYKEMQAMQDQIFLTYVQQFSA